MNYFDIEALSFFQIDHTSRCNLKCPQCARTHKGAVNPELPMGELILDDYKAVFNKKNFKVTQIKSILFSGNYGDAAMSDVLKPAIEFLILQGVLSIKINSNGSLRSPSWWAELAQIMNRENDRMTFSIDGLEDTNHIYRVGSQWNKIIQNAEAFIQAGGNAKWDFLVFEHNAHQVESAQILAKKMGFKEFNIKKTNRFIGEKQYQTGLSQFNQNVLIKNKGDYKISVPISNDNYISKSTKNFDEIIEKHGSWLNYINSTKITCKYKTWGNGLFIDFEARLWPCNWLASPMYHWGNADLQKKQILQVFERYGADFNSLRQRSFKEVFGHRWFQSELVDSWSRQTTVDNPKLITCGRTCGDEYDFSSASSVNHTTMKL